MVTSAADRGEGSLRQALQIARAGTVIRFDPNIFPEESPATILLDTMLPSLSTGGVTIDATDAGVILDGRLLGKEPEQVLLDDITFTFDDGPNLIENGDFNPEDQLNHWRIWQASAVKNFRWNETVGFTEPGAFEWTGTNRQSNFSLIYQHIDEFTNTSGDGKPWADFPEQTWLHLNGTKSVSARFWYRFGLVSLRVAFLAGDGRWFDFGTSFPYFDDWNQAVFQVDVPLEAEKVAFEITIFSSTGANGLWIDSDNNIIQGLQIINFPNNGIVIHNGNQNLIGGAHIRDESGCRGRCNLLSGNLFAGVFIEGGVENIVQGNYMGVDAQGVSAMANGMASVRIFNAMANQIGGSLLQGEGNLLSGGSMGVEINQEGDEGVAEGNLVQGNLIGTNYDGTKALGNHVGISLAGSTHTLIGGSDPDLRNIISGNVAGMYLSRQTRDNLIIGNYIGLDIEGLQAIGNKGSGITVLDGSNHNQIGSIDPGERNLISGNHNTGVLLENFATKQNTIEGNWIGLGADGKTIIPNKINGIFIKNAQDNQIGPGNQIIGNGDVGVRVEIEGELNGNTITRNSITENQGPGVLVWMNGDEVRPVEAFSVSTRSVQGSTLSDATLEIYKDEGNEGEIFLGTLRADSEGSFEWVFPAGITTEGQITLLVTDHSGSTFGFSEPAKPIQAFLEEIPGFISPEQIVIEPEVILLNTGIAVVALLYFGLVTTWINESLENYSQEIALTLNKILRKVKLTRREPLAPKGHRSLSVVLLSWLLILSITAFIQTFLYPQSLFSRTWLGQLATLILSGLIITGLQIVLEWMQRRLAAKRPDVKTTEVSLIGVVLAAISVSLSRLMNFQPGVVLGSVDGLYCCPPLDDPREDGQRALVTKGGIFGLTFIGWLISPLFNQAPGVQALLITLFVVGVQYAFFELLPIRGLDGHMVRKWKLWVWVLAFLISAFGFIYLCLNPDIGDLSALRRNSMLTLGVMALLLLFVAIVFKLFLKRLSPVVRDEENPLLKLEDEPHMEDDN